VSPVHGVLDRDALVAQLIRDEGIRLKPYVDCCGRDWRACVATPCKPAREGHRGNLTIGIGRNLDGVGISREEAMLLLSTGPTNDIDRTATPLKAALPWWPALDDVRQRSLLNMAFNLGVEKLLEFHGTLRAFANGDWKAAAAGMRDSLWAKQVGARAERLAKAVESGRDAGFA
jgi:lysozyme